MASICQDPDLIDLALLAMRCPFGWNLGFLTALAEILLIASSPAAALPELLH